MGLSLVELSQEAELSQAELSLAEGVEEEGVAAGLLECERAYGATAYT